METATSALCPVCEPAPQEPAQSADALRRMPGHWLLAKMGKRVLRPGGIELTRTLLEQLDIQPADDVVEFAPGLGVTARMALLRGPASYTGVERDEVAALEVGSYLSGPRRSCRVGSAEKTGLTDRAASVVYGEAMLTMQGLEQKRRIVAEAFRLLRPGGRYGIHELALTPDDLPREVQEEISREMSCEIHVGARPLTVREWRELLHGAGFLVGHETGAPMHLLEPRRLVLDEGLPRALRFVCNLLSHSAARRRVFSMRRMFRRRRLHLVAIGLVAVKP